MRLVVPVTVALAISLAACGGSSKPSSNPAPSGPPTTAHVAKLASNVPSASAKMICEKEAADQIYQSAPKEYCILVLNIARDLSRRLRHLDEVFAAMH